MTNHAEHSDAVAVTAADEAAADMAAETDVVAAATDHDTSFKA